MNAVYALGIYLGGAAASLSQLLCVAAGLGWRNTYLLVAALGVLVAATTAAVVVEPPRPTPLGPTRTGVRFRRDRFV